MRLTDWLVCVCSEKPEQLGLTPIDEEEDEEDKEEKIEKEEEEEIRECEENGSELEFKAPQSQQSSATPQSLSFEGSSSSTEVDTSDTDASGSKSTAKSRGSSQDQEEHTYNSKGKKKSFKITSKIREVRVKVEGSTEASCFVSFQTTYSNSGSRKYLA